MALLAPAALGAASFEGKISLKITAPDGKTQQLNLSVKDTLTRTELPGGPGGGGALITDAAKRQMTILIPQQHMYMIQTLPAPGSPAPSAPPAQPAAPPTLERTGMTEKILGYDSVKFVVKDRGATTEIWVTDQLGTFSFLGMAGGPPGPGRRGAPRGPSVPQGWEQLLQGKEMFPLRVVSTAADGKVTRVEVTALEKGALPAAEFVPPADYQDMGQMMRGMGLPGMPGGMQPPGGG